jgi:hypothetical protein
MPSTVTVAQRPRTRRAAVLPAARSICAISQPLKMPPAGLVSAGMAMVRMTGAPVGDGDTLRHRNFSSVLVLAGGQLGGIAQPDRNDDVDDDQAHDMMSADKSRVEP